MIKLSTTRYYGYLTTNGSHACDTTFHVLCIAPPGASVRNYIGSKDVKFTDLLCLDDYILSALPDTRVDWSEVQKY